MEGNIEKQNIGQENSSETLEQPFSPEKVEMIMKKVKDINEQGTAFTVFSPFNTNREKDPTIAAQDDVSKLKAVLENGLLGRDQSRKDEVGQIVTKETWKKDVKQRKARVYFNIVGREIADHDTERPGHIKKIEEYRFFEWLKGSLAIIFDLSSFKEELPGGKLPDSYFQVGGEVDEKSRKFRVTKDDRWMPGVLDSRIPVSDEDYGFNLSFRVPPRFFTGILFRMYRRLSKEELEEKISKAYSKQVEGRGKILYRTEKEIEQLIENEKSDLRHRIESNPFTLETRSEVLRAKAEKIAQLMLEVNRDKPDNLIPIYDIHGNLWWPKQMSYKEVKRHADEIRQIDSSGIRPSANE